MTAIMTSPAALQSLIVDTFRGYRYQFTIGPTMLNTAEPPDESPGSMTFESILIDGILYLDFSGIPSQTETEAEEIARIGWIGFDLAQTVGLNAWLAGLPEPGEGSDIAEIAGIGREFTTVRRLANETASYGTELDVFETSSGLTDMLRFPELHERVQVSLRSDNPDIAAEARGVSRILVNVAAVLADGVQRKKSLSMATCSEKQRSSCASSPVYS